VIKKQICIELIRNIMLNIFIYLDGDPCFYNPCKNSGTCYSNADLYVCVCPYEYMGTHCETRKYHFII